MAAFTGVVDFENTFEGHLPASEYPKINVSVLDLVVRISNEEESGKLIFHPFRPPSSHLPSRFQFYLTLSAVYLLFGVAWAALCLQHRRQLLAIQHYITGTTVFLIIENLAIFSYYSYLNNSGHPGVAKVLLLVVAVLNAARNSVSFFMLLITAMGYGIVKPSLGPVMAKVRLLTIVHFVFGIL